jgi:hypothetical protein
MMMAYYYLFCPIDDMHLTFHIYQAMLLMSRVSSGYVHIKGRFLKIWFGNVETYMKIIRDIFFIENMAISFANEI